MLSLGSYLIINTRLPAAAASTENFSLGLIVSANTVIDTATRVKTYSSITAMEADGFASDSEEVAAATLYFEQSPAPAMLAVGVKGGAESFLDAVTACRAANTQWYACVCLGAAKSDHIAVAPFIESALPAAIMPYTTADTDCSGGVAGNVGLTLKAAGYDRSCGLFSTKTADAAVALMGYICGIAQMMSFDLLYKTLTGVTAEQLTSTQVANLDTASLNYYATYENTYTFFAKGVTASGKHVDQIVGLDILRANIKSNIMSVLMSNAKVPLTDAGMTLITNAITSACAAAETSGFIAPGTWNGGTVVGLKNGAALPNGYSIQIAPISTLSSADRASRVTPPIYVCIIFADSGESFVVNIDVQQ